MPVRTERTIYAFTVQESCDVEVVARSTDALVPGDTVEFQFPHSWSLVNGPSYTRAFQADDPEAAHYVCVEAPGAAFAMDIRKRHLPYPAGAARHGRHIVATLTEGSVPADTPIRIRYANTFAPYVAETEALWLRVKGTAPGKPIELCTRAGPGVDLRVIAPSVVRPGEAFDVLIVSLDRLQNRSTTRHNDVRLSLSDGTVVADALTFTGAMRVSATLSDEGVFRFHVDDVVSNAVRVSRTGTKLRWGDIHVHSKYSSDGQGSDPYGYARDVSGLDFAAAADHWCSLGELGNLAVEDLAEQAHDPGRFVTLLADERNPAAWTGHHNIYFRNHDAFAEYRDDPDAQANPHNPEFDLTRVATDPPELMIVPHHTGIAFGDLPRDREARGVDLDAVDDRGLRPVVEIYSHHGQSEQYAPQHALAYELNRMRRPERRANTCIPGPFYAHDYWMAGRRLGVIGSSDDHAGQAGIRHGGIAAAWTDYLTRDAVFDAIFSRRCYATTGERILVDFSVDGVAMGCESACDRGHTVSIRLDVWGTRRLLRVDVLRYRFGVDRAFEPILSCAPRPESLDVAFELDDTITHACMYYARVVQEPLDWPDMAWTSPVWIDVQEEVPNG